jgi:hypothetical protein
MTLGCGLKTREPRDAREPTVVEEPVDDGEEPLDIEAEIKAASDAAPDEGEAPLPMESEFLKWNAAVDEAPQPGRITGGLTRTVTFELTNTLDRLLTGQIVVAAPHGVSLVPGETIGWRLRGGRSASIPARVTIVEGAPLGQVTLPITITVHGQDYRTGRLELWKWLDMRTIGPFPVEASDLGVACPPENEVDFDAGCEWRGTKFAWRLLPLKALQPDGLIDFRRLYGDAATGCAYAAVHLHAEAAAGVVLAFRCESPSVVWLNNERVINAPARRADESTTEVTLKRGTNTILVKCCRANERWAFVLNVAGKYGELPPGVRFNLVLRGRLEKEATGASTPAGSGE